MTLRRSFISIALVLSSVLLGTAPGRGSPKDQFSIFRLEFAAAAADDESLSHGLYFFRVWGDSTFLELQRITLNECSNVHGEEASFAPYVDIWTTTSPLRLKATKVSDSRIELSLFQGFHHGYPATMTLTFDSNGPPFSKLTGLKTSGFIDLRYFPGEVRYVDYKLIETERLKKLDCPVYLPGLSSNNRWRVP